MNLTADMTFKEFEKAWWDHERDKLNKELADNGQFDDIPYYLYYDKGMRCFPPSQP